MAIYSSNRIYIGNFAQMDLGEGNYTNENNFPVIGTYDSSMMEMAAMTVDDANNSGFLESDDAGQVGETVTYTVGGVTTTSVHDAEATFNSIVTLNDGTTFNLVIGVYQTQDGATFLSHDTALDGLKIDQIQLTSLAGDFTNGFGNLGDYGIDGGGIVCFTKGTLIETESGPRSIEDLQAGDMVKTLDGGMQPIRWIGATTVPATGTHAPVVFDKDSVGNTHVLRVSPQHRMLLPGWGAELMFGVPEVLCAAIYLVNGTTIRQEEGGVVTYYHMMFDAHQIVFAQGALCESFHPGHQGLGSMPEATRAEIFALFPQLKADVTDYSPTARLSLKRPEAEALLAVG